MVYRNLKQQATKKTIRSSKNMAYFFLFNVKQEAFKVREMKNERQKNAL